MYHDAKSCCCCPFCYVAAIVVVVVVRFALLFTQVVASSCFVFQSSIYCSCARFMEFAAGCNLKCVREYVKTNEMVSSWESVLQVVIIYEIIQNSQTYNRSMYLNISWNYPIYHLSTYVCTQFPLNFPHIYLYYPQYSCNISHNCLCVTDKESK